MPAVLVASDGRDVPGHAEGSLGILLRDLDLATLVGVAATARPMLAVDLDSVEGLSADAAGVAFVVRRLGIAIVMTRRPQLAARIAELGGLGLVRIFAFDSTGLGRSLDSHPSIERVGTVISPGPVLGHLTPADRARLPRPIVAYGLIDTPEQALELLGHADSVVVRPSCAAAIVAAGGAAGSGLGALAGLERERATGQ